MASHSPPNIRSRPNHSSAIPGHKNRAAYFATHALEADVEYSEATTGRVHPALANALRISQTWDKAFAALTALRHRVDRSYLDPRSEADILSELRRDLDAVKQTAGTKAGAFTSWLAD